MLFGHVHVLTRVQTDPEIQEHQMKLLRSFMLGILAIVAITHAQEPAVNSSLQSLVETERAFSRTSAERSTREAFLSFIADDGILFRPAAVNGKEWLNKNPVAPSEKRPLLSWQPIFADVSLAGDLGYTTGPWQYKLDIKDEKPVAYGNFITVWRKQADGTWKFAVDLGITNAAPANPLPEWQPQPKVQKQVVVVPKIDQEAQRSTLINHDRELSHEAAAGAVKAFLALADTEVRVFRNNSFPFIGKPAAEQALSANKNSWTWEPATAGVSSSGDLGYTYGSYELRTSDPTKAVTEKGNYLRIWKRKKGTWMIVVDVANPLPEKKN